MSIHHYKEKLLKSLKDRSYVGFYIHKDPKRVAYLNLKSVEKPYIPKKYDLSELKEIVRTYKYKNKFYDHVFVEKEYFDYNFCNEDNISKNLETAIIEKEAEWIHSVKDKKIDKKKFCMGYLVFQSLMIQILVNMYIITDNQNFKKYITMLSFNKNTISMFLLDLEFILPLNENYLTLINSVITNEKILDFVGKNYMRFSADDLDIVLENYKLTDIHHVCQVVFDTEEDDLTKLKYISVILSHTERVDYVSDYIDINLDKKTEHAGFRLLTHDFDLTGAVDELYKKVVQSYKNLNGILKFNFKGKYEKVKEIKEIIEARLEYLEAENL